MGRQFCSANRCAAVRQPPRDARLRAVDRKRHFEATGFRYVLVALSRLVQTRKGSGGVLEVEADRLATDRPALAQPQPKSAGDRAAPARTATRRRAVSVSHHRVRRTQALPLPHGWARSGSFCLCCGSGSETVRPPVRVICASGASRGDLARRGRWRRAGVRRGVEWWGRERQTVRRPPC